MLSATLLATLVQAVPAAPAPVVPSPPAMTLTAPADWSHLPLLPWRTAPRVTPDVAAVIEREAAGDGCRPAARPLIVDFAVFVRGDGAVRAVVPRAIDCPTVEQFAAGLVTRYARNNLRQPAAGWYRTAIVFDRR